MRDKLIIFTRYPEEGKTKTRMIHELGKKGAALLQKRLTEHTIINMQKLKDIHKNINLEVHFSGGNYQLMTQWLGEDLTFIEQKSGDLGEKMQSAFTNSFKEECQKVIIVGIDCPDLNINIIKEGFNKLNNCDLILGPAADGGYYLIGLSKDIPHLFKNIKWGTSTVFRETINIAKKLNLKTANLEILPDIDRPEDLPIWEKYVNN